jgi:flagellar hook-length control protein FliK
MQNVKNNNNSDSKGNLQDTVFKSAEKDSKTATNKNFAFKDLVSNLENPDKILSAKNGNEKTLGEFKQEINFDSMSRLASKTSEQNNVKTVNIDSPNDIFKITDLVEIAKNSSSKKLTVQLEPHNLGKMNIQLTEQAGKLTAKFFVENDTVKHIMVNNADQIRAQLADKGIVIHDMDFMFMDDYDSQQRFHENAERLRQQFKNGDNSGNQEEEMENEKYDRKSGIYA